MAKKISVDWRISYREKNNIKPVITKYHRYLETIGLKENTIKLYLHNVSVYLEAVGDNKPTSEDAKRFYESLYDKKLSKSSLNNYAAAIIKYHDMINEPVKIKFLKLNNSLPYYFDESDILKIFNVIDNFKHYCMFNVLFYGCLRSGELCQLDDSDYDSEHLTLRLRETKNGSDALALLNDQTARILNKYLKIRPQLKIDGRYPLFYTDWQHRWSPNQIYKVFLYYKKKACIEKKGAVHCFSRHSSATLMLEKGCDVRIVKEVLRHKDLNTTLRYAHVSDVTKRKSYEKFLTLGDY